MAVLLIVANDQKDIENMTLQNCNYLSLGIEEKEIYQLLIDIKWYLDKIDRGCSDDFLFKLEIYGEEILSKERIENYLNFSKVLLKEELIRFLEDNDVFKNYYLYYNEEESMKKENYINYIFRTVFVAFLEEKN